MTSEKLKKGKECAVPINDQELDASVEMTFPASDPPSVGGSTKLKERPSDERRPKATGISKKQVK